MLSLSLPFDGNRSVAAAGWFASQATATGRTTERSLAAGAPAGRAG